MDDRAESMKAKAESDKRQGTRDKGQGTRDKAESDKGQGSWMTRTSQTREKVTLDRSPGDTDREKVVSDVEPNAS